MIKEKKKKRRRRWPIELIRPREEGRMRTRVETTVEPSTTTSWTVSRRFESRNKSERGRVMFVPRLSRYFNSLFLSLSRSLRSKRRKKNCNYGWRLIYIYIPSFLYHVFHISRESCETIFCLEKILAVRQPIILSPTRVSRGSSNLVGLRMFTRL